MTHDDAPILEFDPDRSAIIEPTMTRPPIEGFPARAVITWMRNAFDHFAGNQPVTEVSAFRLESASTPIYRHDTPDGPVVVALAPVGAATSAALVEELISSGCSAIFGVGSSGGLVADLAPGSVVVPTAAIRDEGVSYHYAPADTFAQLDASAQAVVAQTFSDAGFDVSSGITWTTDAFFRETEAKVARRQAQGANVVDMEAAALATVAAFRGVQYGAALYVADTLYGDEWDPTELVKQDLDYRYRLLLTAIQAAVQL